MEFVLFVFAVKLFAGNGISTDKELTNNSNRTSANALPGAFFKKKIPWPESASELYQPSDRLLSAKLVPTFADRGCHVVNMTDPYSRILGFLDRRRYFFFQAAPQLYSRG
jgi:hypothetical protein